MRKKKFVSRIIIYYYLLESLTSLTLTLGSEEVFEEETSSDELRIAFGDVFGDGEIRVGEIRGE